jgi:SAM-dependent methyltransferase
MDREAAFWNKLADKYSRRPVADEAAYQKKLEVTRQYFQPDMEVLEIGCGTGSTAIAHAPYVGHIRATDLSARMIEIAKDRAKVAGIENVTFEASSIDALDVPDASVDVVMAHSVLHLLEDKEQVIADVHKMLKPGGVFVSSTACIGDMMHRRHDAAPPAHYSGGAAPAVVPARESLLSCRLEDQSRDGRFRHRLRMAAQKKRGRVHHLSKTVVRSQQCQLRSGVTKRLKKSDTALQSV